MAAIESDPVSVGNAKALVDGVKEWVSGGGLRLTRRTPSGT